MARASARDLSGVVQPGRGRGTALMADDAVLELLEELAGFRVAPGTLNVRLPGPLERGADWRYVSAAEISPDWKERSGQTGYFIAPVTIAGRHPGLAFQADEPGYPPDQIELFSDVHLRRALGVGDCDPISVTMRADDGA